MIRRASIFDMNFLICAMVEYAEEAKIDVLNNNHNAEHVKQVFRNIMAGKGVILMDDRRRGFLAAAIAPNLWNPELLQLSEIAFWVDPAYRGGSVGGRLFLEFNRIADEMLKEGQVHLITTSLRGESPKLDYIKYGYTSNETTYIKEK